MDLEAELTERGHVIRETEPDVWVYADDGSPVKTYREVCGHCGLKNTPEGHDGCLGTLPGVMNACCGHGDPDQAYVQFEGSTILRPLGLWGPEAAEWIKGKLDDADTV